jgi:hypothetical protein
MADKSPIFLLGVFSVMTRPGRCVVASPGASYATRRVGALTLRLLSADCNVLADKYGAAN